MRDKILNKQQKIGLKFGLIGFVLFFGTFFTMMALEVGFSVGIISDRYNDLILILYIFFVHVGLGMFLFGNFIVIASFLKLRNVELKRAYSKKEEVQEIYFSKFGNILEMMGALLTLLLIFLYFSFPLLLVFSLFSIMLLLGLMIPGLVIFIDSVSRFKIMRNFGEIKKGGVILYYLILILIVITCGVIIYLSTLDYTWNFVGVILCLFALFIIIVPVEVMSFFVKKKRSGGPPKNRQHTDVIWKEVQEETNREVSEIGELNGFTLIKGEKILFKTKKISKRNIVPITLKLVVITLIVALFLAILLFILTLWIVLFLTIILSVSIAFYTINFALKIERATYYITSKRVVQKYGKGLLKYKLMYREILLGDVNRFTIDLGKGLSIFSKTQYSFYYGTKGIKRKVLSRNDIIWIPLKGSEGASICEQIKNILAKIIPAIKHQSSDRVFISLRNKKLQKNR
ncbi:MAG: hypothetical protein ACTSPD_12610 [Promethearchaeota archaeon]